MGSSRTSTFNGFKLQIMFNSSAAPFRRDVSRADRMFRRSKNLITESCEKNCSRAIQVENLPFAVLTSGWVGDCNLANYEPPFDAIASGVYVAGVKNSRAEHSSPQHPTNCPSNPRCWTRSHALCFVPIFLLIKVFLFFILTLFIKMYRSLW